MFSVQQSSSKGPCLLSTLIHLYSGDHIIYHLHEDTLGHERGEYDIKNYRGKPGPALANLTREPPFLYPKGRNIFIHLGSSGLSDEKGRDKESALTFSGPADLQPDGLPIARRSCLLEAFS